MISNLCLKDNFNPLNYFKTMSYNRKFRLSHPFYFNPDGLVVFVGPQGSGKTLSAVNYVYNLKQFYPKSIIVTNIDLRDFPVDNKTVFRFTNADDLIKYKNGYNGVIFLIDEIHLYFNSLQSKNINMDVMTQISQQRKQRIHIVATCQVFGRMAKPLREQFSSVLLCRSYFNSLQCNLLIDRDSIQGEESTGLNISGQVKKKYWWFRSPEMFERYDTYSVIENKSLSVSTYTHQNIYDLGGVHNAS